MTKNSQNWLKLIENEDNYCHSVFTSWSIMLKLGRYIIGNEIYCLRLKNPCQGHFKVKGQGQIWNFVVKTGGKSVKMKTFTVTVPLIHV